MNAYTFFVTHRVEIFSTTLEHVELVLIAMAIAVAIAIPLGIFMLMILIFKLHSRRQLQQYFDRKIQQARERDLWPKSGELPTLEHVKRLAQSGEKNLAIKLYHQVHNASCKDARAAVERMAALR